MADNPYKDYKEGKRNNPGLDLFWGSDVSDWFYNATKGILLLESGSPVLLEDEGGIEITEKAVARWRKPRYKPIERRRNYVRKFQKP